MRQGNVMDKIKEWVSAHKTILIQIGAVISIAIVVCAIMVNDMAASKDEFTAEVTRLDGGITTVGSTVSSLGTKVVATETIAKANQSRIDGVSDTLAETSETIAALDTRMELAKGQIDTLITLTQGIGGLEVVVANITANLTAQGQTLVALNTTATDHSAAIEALAADITAIEAAIEALEVELATMTRPPEAWLTGSFSNYTVHARAGKTGDYLAIVHLCYAPPIGIEEFYGSINWDVYALSNYVEEWTWAGGDDWAITKVSFSIGVFDIKAGKATTIQVVTGGIHADYAPNWAYVEIWPVKKES